MKTLKASINDFDHKKERGSERRLMLQQYSSAFMLSSSYSLFVTYFLKNIMKKCQKVKINKQADNTFLITSTQRKQIFLSRDCLQIIGSFRICITNFTLMEGDQVDGGMFSVPVKIALIGIGVVSSIISLMVPSLYYVRQKCCEHPMALIAIISLLEALSNYNVILIAVNIYEFEEFMDVQRVFHYLVYFWTKDPTETDFCIVNFTLYILLELLSIAYNICFSADLLITLKKPFFAGRKRMKFYHILSLLFVACFLPLSMIQAEDICQGEFHSKSIYRIPLAFLSSLGVFYIFSMIITIMSFQHPQNNEIRSRYIRHHRMILFTLVLVWAFPMATNILILLGDQTSRLFKICNLASFISLLISGGLITTVRFLTDTFLWVQMKKTICQCKLFETSVREIQEQSKEKEDVWNLPLANAVSTSQYQRVISNIIQIVLETCSESNQTVEEDIVSKIQRNSTLLNKKKSQRQETEKEGEEGSSHKASVREIQAEEDHMQDIRKSPHSNFSNLRFSDHYYEYGTQILQINEIKQFLKSGTHEELKKVSKISKEIQMICVEEKQPSNSKKKSRNITSPDNSNPIDSNLTFGSHKSETVRRKTSVDSSNGQKQKQITIKVKSLADPLFVALRINDNITSEQLRKTLNLDKNNENITKARQSLGASGSFFFFSYDNKFVIKTISEGEVEVFIKLLPFYYSHIMKYPNSLLSRAYGLFSVQIAGVSKINFIMMENTFESFENDKVFYKKYDLKGSTIKRQVKDSAADVFKDINYLHSNDSFLLLSKERKQRLMKQIKADINLLSSHNIMDYSLLLGIGNLKKTKKTHRQSQWRYFEDGSEVTGKIYSLSLIDYLQQFNMNKYMELTLKKMFKGGGDISSIDTEAYKTRFLNFMNRITVVCRF